MFGGVNGNEDYRRVALVIPVALVGTAGIVTAAAFGPYVLVGYFVASGVVGWLLRWKIRRDRASGHLDLHRCPTEYIGYAWQVTTVLLDKSDPAGRLRLVQARQAYLDELHRRDPRAIEDWAREAMRGSEERPDTYLRNHHEST